MGSITVMTILVRNATDCKECHGSRRLNSSTVKLTPLILWRRKGQTVFFQPVKVKQNGFLDVAFGFLNRSPVRMAAG
jgi:hypothetical protein